MKRKWEKGDPSPINPRLTLSEFGAALMNFLEQHKEEKA